MTGSKIQALIGRVRPWAYQSAVGLAVFGNGIDREFDGYTAGRRAWRWEIGPRAELVAKWAAMYGGKA